MEGGADTWARVVASEESVGAAIGRFWRHRTLDLDADRRDYSDDMVGLRRYGEAVLDELADAGYTDDDVRTLIEAITPRLISALQPAPEEVAVRAATFPDG